MSTEIALASEGLVGQVERLVHSIKNATAAEAKAAHDRLGMAREWAKLQDNASELAERLVWLEAVILRRIGELDPKALPAAKRAAARHFATLDDDALSLLLNDYPARSAVSAYNLWARAEGIKSARQRGRAVQVGHYREKVDDDEDVSETLRHVVEYRSLTVRQAAAVLLQEYAWTRERGTVSDIVDAFIDDESPTTYLDASPLEASAFRAGLTDAVRTAFATAPVDTTEHSHEIPAFITTHDDETDQWVRIPSEFATVRDALDMLAQRKGQVETLQRSYAKLESVLAGQFDVRNRDSSEYLRDDMTAILRRERRRAG